tara:strand:- start:367 stop:690 length:324 start_codon:yes stop_codon:yes gene_type:complete
MVLGLGWATTTADPRLACVMTGVTLDMTENEQHEIERLEERVRDLERQLAQEEASHLTEVEVLKHNHQTEVEILKHDLMRANLKTRLQLQDEIDDRRTARRAAQFAK